MKHSTSFHGTQRLLQYFRSPNAAFNYGYNRMVGADMDLRTMALNMPQQYTHPSAYVHPYVYSAVDTRWNRMAGAFPSRVSSFGPIMRFPQNPLAYPGMGPSARFDTRARLYARELAWNQHYNHVGMFQNPQQPSFGIPPNAPMYAMARPSYGGGFYRGGYGGGGYGGGQMGGYGMDAPSHPFMSSPMRPMMADVYSYHIGSYVGLDPQTGQLGVVETVTPLSGGGGVGYEEAGGGRGVSNGNTASSSIETSTGSSSTSTEQSSKASSDSVSKLRSQLDQIRSQLTTGTAQVKEAQSQSKRLREEIVKLRSTANTSAAEVKQFTAKMQQQREEIAAQNKKLTEESGQLAAKLKQSLAKAIADAGPGADTSAIEKKLAAEMMPLLENLETQMKNNNSLLDAQLSVLEKQQAAVQSTNKVTNAQLQKAEIDLKSAENRAEKLLQQNTLLSRRIQEMTREIEQRANRLTQR